MIPTPRAVLFDWDGTLFDTAEATFRCYVRLFADYGIPFDREAYARSYAPNWYHTFRHVGLGEQHWPDANKRWLHYFADESCTLLPGVWEALHELTAAKLLIGIVTSGERGRVERELAEHGIAAHVHHAVFGDDVAHKKPHPEALERCLRELAVEPKDAVFIGDSPEDIAMAKAAGVFSIAVKGGYPNAEALAAAEPDVMADTTPDAIRMLLG